MKYKEDYAGEITMGKMDDRLNRMLEIFEEHNSIELEALVKEFNVTDRTVKSDIAKLRKRGIDVELKNGNCTYRLQNRFSRVNSINQKDIRNSIILQIVSENPANLDRSELIDCILKRVISTDSISYKTLERAIKDLEDEYILNMDKDGKYNISIGTETIYSIPKEDAYRFCYYQSIYGKDFPFSRLLKSVSKKITSAINEGEDSEDDYEEDKFITIGRRFHDDEHSVNLIMKLEESNYTKKNLKVRYNTNKGYIKDLAIDVVVILYNFDKDRTYVVGITQKGLTLLDIEKIQSIETMNLENKYFMDSGIMEKVNMMFSSATDGPHKVKVKFQNIYNIKEKMDKLKQNRKTAYIFEEGNYFIYEDTIYGLYDFAGFLRKFGRSCEVIEPIELRDIMKETYKKLLESYGL